MEDIKKILVWSFSKNLRKMNIMRKIKENENMQENIYSLLFEKKEDENNVINNFNQNNNDKKNKTLFSEKISKKCNSLLTNMYDKINLINLKSNQLNKINCLSLQKISKKYYRMNSSKPFSSLHNLKTYNILTTNSIQSTNNNNHIKKFPIKNKNNENQLRTINSKFLKLKKLKNENRNIESYHNMKKNNIIINKRTVSSKIKNKNKEDKLKIFANFNIDELYKSDKVNIERFNDAFRIEMNNTFYKFNPKEHLKELNEMQKYNISVRKDMETIKEKIKNKIDIYTNKKNNIKQYKIKNENININNNSTRILRNIPEKIPFNIKFKSQNNIFPYGYKTRALYDFHTHSKEIEKNKEKMNHKKTYKEKNMKKLYKINDILIDKTLKKLYTSLDTKRILKYINDIKKEKINNNVNNNENIVEIKKNKYFPAFREIKGFLTQYENINCKNKNNEDENIEKHIIDIENKLKINEKKDHFLEI
jgi:hypothetical protein